VFACAHQVTKVRIPDETNHFQLVSYPCTSIDIGYMHSGVVSHAVVRTTNSSLYKLQTVA